MGKFYLEVVKGALRLAIANSKRPEVALPVHPGLSAPRALPQSRMAPPVEAPPKPPVARTQPAPQVPSRPPLAPPAPPLSQPAQALPTTEETRAELKRRLGKELYRMELDLQGGGRIAGRPCDCLSKKHNLGIEATAEELMAMAPSPVYGELVEWIRTREPEFEPAEIAKRPPEYYQGLIPRVRAFRKQVMGTEALGPLLTKQETAQVMAKLQERLK